MRWLDLTRNLRQGRINSKRTCSLWRERGWTGSVRWRVPCSCYRVAGAARGAAWSRHVPEHGWIQVSHGFGATVVDEIGDGRQGGPRGDLVPPLVEQREGDDDEGGTS